MIIIATMFSLYLSTSWHDLCTYIEVEGGKKCWPSWFPVYHDHHDDHDQGSLTSLTIVSFMTIDSHWEVGQNKCRNKPEAWRGQWWSSRWPPANDHDHDDKMIIIIWPWLSLIGDVFMARWYGNMIMKILMIMIMPMMRKDRPRVWWQGDAE